jgi:integrase
MGRYATRGRAPKTLTVAEQERLLRVTGEHARGFRDHVLIAIGLGLGLRIHEVAALDCGDVYDHNGKAKRRIELRVFKQSNQDEQAQCVHVPDSLKYKLDKFRRWKVARGEPVKPGSPLFVTHTGSRSKMKGSRLSDRAIRHAFNGWLTRLGYEPDSRGRYPFSFHSLRHTCGTNLFRQTKDLRVVQRQLRHASIQSTMIYTTPSDDDVARGVKDLDC